MKPVVAAVVATFNREREVAQLIRSLVPVRALIGKIILTDNAGILAEDRLTSPDAPAIQILQPGENLGCGGGLSCAMKRALESMPDVTHFWILDDDVEVAPDTLPVLLEEMTKHSADLAYPMVVDGSGKVGWFPGLMRRGPWAAIRSVETADEYRRRCGDESVPFSWSPGVALLVSRRAVEEVGMHRPDFWVRGEDLEFSVRVTARFRGIFVPRTTVRHLFAHHGAGIQNNAEYLKRCAHLQNAIYISTRLPHARPMLRYLPGNIVRFLHDSHWRPRALRDLAIAVRNGAIRGVPAGAENGADFQARAARSTR